MSDACRADVRHCCYILCDVGFSSSLDATSPTNVTGGSQASLDSVFLGSSSSSSNSSGSR